MIEVKNVSFKYKNQNEILKDINLIINSGEVVCIIGKNGTGKSTLIKIISGILKPTKGNVLVDGIDEYKKKNFELTRKKIGVVFQNPDNQILFNNVYDDVEFSLKNLKIENRDIKINESLKLVDMIKHKNDDTFKLSLGQKQRVNIASALAINPSYLILDEPTTMIDSNGKEKIYKIINELKMNKNTVIFVTNNINEILLADKVIIMDNKKIEVILNKEEIIRNIDLLKKFDIYIPDILKIIIALNKKGVNIDLENYTIEEISNKIVEVIEY